LQFLKVHNASYLLIISDEIGKYQAYSSIGSDENYDIFSWIGTYVMVPGASEEDGLMVYTFAGGTVLDEDFLFEGKVYPAKRTVIAYFKVPVDESDIEDLKIKQPSAVLYLDGETEEVPVGCLYDLKEKILFEKQGLEGCIRIMPRVLSDRYQQENGAMLYVSRKGMDALWTRLFLFDEESDAFELVYDDSGTRQLSDYYGNVRGPLKIWKVNYPGNLTVSPKLKREYLDTSSPVWMNLSKKTILEI
jgi:hypothetical protein